MPNIVANLNFLKNKVNVRAIGTRNQEATADDFKEIATIFETLIDAVNLITGDATQNNTYGVHTSLNLLQSAYPTAEPGAYAIIDPGTGVASKLALWDDTDNQWVVQETTSKTTTSKIVVEDLVTNVEVTDATGDPYLIVSGTYKGPDALKLESYSKNSIYRAL